MKLDVGRFPSPSELTDGRRNLNAALRVSDSFDSFRFFFSSFLMALPTSPARRRHSVETKTQHAAVTWGKERKEGTNNRNEILFNKLFVCMYGLTCLSIRNDIDPLVESRRKHPKARLGIWKKMYINEDTKRGEK